MGFSDWIKGLGKKGAGHLSKADVEAIARYALDKAAHDGAEAAKAALDAGRTDNDIVMAAIKAAAMEIGLVWFGMQDTEVTSLLEVSHPNTRKAVLDATRIALRPDNLGGSLPAQRVRSLNFAFDLYSAQIMKGARPRSIG
jgi:isopropylmalate/homocitrate/citramalate synthase